MKNSFSVFPLRHSQSFVRFSFFSPDLIRLYIFGDGTFCFSLFRSVCFLIATALTFTDFFCARQRIVTTKTFSLKTSIYFFDFLVSLRRLLLLWVHRISMRRPEIYFRKFANQRQWQAVFHFLSHMYQLLHVRSVSLTLILFFCFSFEIYRRHFQEHNIFTRDRCCFRCKWYFVCLRSKRNSVTTTTTTAPSILWSQRQSNNK